MTKEQLMTLIQTCRAMEKFDEASYKLTGGSHLSPFASAPRPCNNVFISDH